MKAGWTHNGLWHKIEIGDTVEAREWHDGSKFDGDRELYGGSGALHKLLIERVLTGLQYL